MADDDHELTKKEMNEEARTEPGNLQSRFSRWLRRIIVILLIFIMLVAIAWFALIGPKAAQIASLQTELATAQKGNATLEAQIAEFQSLKAQRSVLSLLVDANTARFELAKGDKQAATSALLNTGNTLYQLDLELGADYDETISSLETRLLLAREGIQSENNVSSLNDLEVLINTLQNLLQSLSSQ